MKKLNLFIIFAIAIMAGCTALCILGCSADEYDDFGDDEIYTLSKRKKTRVVETGEGVGNTTYGNVTNGELLWHKKENTTYKCIQFFFFNIFANHLI